MVGIFWGGTMNETAILLCVNLLFRLLRGIKTWPCNGVSIVLQSCQQTRYKSDKQKTSKVSLCV